MKLDDMIYFINESKDLTIEKNKVQNEKSSKKDSYQNPFEHLLPMPAD